MTTPGRPPLPLPVRLFRQLFRRLGSRLGAAFGAVLTVTLLVAMAAMALLAMVRQLNADSATETTRLVQVRQWTEQVRVNLERALQATRLDAVAADDEGLRQRLAPLAGRLVEEMATTAQASAEMQQRMLSGDVPDDVRQRVAAIEHRRRDFVSLRARLRDDLQMGEDPKRIDAQLQPAAEAMVSELAGLASALAQRSTAAAARVDSRVELAMVLLAGGAAAAVLLGALLAWRMTRALTRPLREAADLARRIADGDLRPHPGRARDDELGDLLHGLGAMQSQLARVIEGIHGSTRSILQASDLIAGSNQDLDARTSEAAHFIERTTGSMDALSQTVQQNSQAADTAGRLAGEAAAVARRGGEVVERVVSTMHDIQSSARRIADISATIDGIAFQTNILALNAAVEAARAGDQGRSFAVVAGEVRSLAQRTATASREIKTLIESSVERAEAGSRLVSEAGSTMGDIVGSVQRVSEVIEAVTGKAREQAGGIVEIGDAVGQLDQMTRQNAALVRDNGGVAQDLREHARRLADAVSAFRLDDQPALASSGPGQSRM